jgi:maltose alpha-D-glucosyltransferase / alpha-amylase
MSQTLPPPTEDPLWYKDAVIYQLHVKSFFDADNDGVGDFEGLIQKLDYISELGVTAIWLLPFYPSPRRDDGYDIEAYRGVHPEYGRLLDARRLIEMAHARGLRVVTELVVNHTSDQHPWFQRARRSPPGSPERDFYVWSDSDQKYGGTRTIFVDSEKSNWTWDAVANAYFWHRFYSHQPDLNFDNPLVMQEVLSIMKFWLDLGVDGLRLDAVPYLVEREGTNNENLRETHDVLKRIRAELELHASGRMLLAEANQWPEDAQQYFGDGDECHMAFHFPLMPRMYMAIAREDRFPITDIMRQTPEIPSTCQWAIFLRNHDELTLEMVTTAERDYLWETYATDRRARLNLGIRRRLAPLLEHDRRRIELMNGLLLSMPGTPVIYYGDELGMGDNIHLGDRDGVRTPMQWSIDRNGGFSRADPARLVLPPIMDSIYGFQAVNVEAQAADSHSLLSWMRRMLAVRQQHRAFGRGTQRFLYPNNRKILAFLREFVREGDADETLLCVYNLSRAAQAVELDLTAFSGRVPVEILGGSAFPPIGQLTYLLTLPPYGFYWFLLASDEQLPVTHSPVPEPLPEFATFVLRRELTDALSPPWRTILENEVLPTYLQKRRWFAGKADVLHGVRVAYAVPVPEQPILVTELEAQVGDHFERYVLPVGIGWDDEQTDALVQPLALARVRRGARVGYLTDAFALDPLVRAWISAMRGAVVVGLGGEQGEIRFYPTALMEELKISDDAPIRRFSAEQSNSSLVVDDLLVLKIIRRVNAGIHPEGEMTRFLTGKEFANTTPLYGEVVRVSPEGTPHTIGLVQGFIRNQGDGWSWTLDFLARAISELVLTTQEGLDERAAWEDIFGEYAVFAAAMGRRLAELHAVLSQPSADPAFSPEEVEAATLATWGDDAVAQLEAALALIDRNRDWPDEDSKRRAAELVTRADALRIAARRLASRGAGSLRTRVHGDFHLGQVLVAQGDAYLIDFEGEPARTLARRRDKSSGLRDVAGLLRSFDYAAATAAVARGAVPSGTAERRSQLLDQFREAASDTFLAAYYAVLDATERRWVTSEAAPALLELFLLEKAAYEICYEAANRPSWIGIPLRGIAEIADRILGNGDTNG